MKMARMYSRAAPDVGRSCTIDEKCKLRSKVEGHKSAIESSSRCSQELQNHWEM